MIQARLDGIHKRAHWALWLLISSSVMLAPITASAVNSPQNGATNQTAAQKKDKAGHHDKNNPIAPKTQSQIEAENGLHRALLEQKLSGIVARIERLRLEKEYKRLSKELDEEEILTRHRKEMQQLQMQKEKLVAEIELAQAKLNKQMEASTISAIQLERKIQLEKGKMQLLQEQKNRAQAEIDAWQMEQNRGRYLFKKPIYLKDPLRKKDNALILSDRCIKVSLVITPWSANKIIDEIQYFNNQSTAYPIFLVIDCCHGGSVQAGWDILQAMKCSQAPVYVVVKRFAASMAALVTTLAHKSYAYPNAVILHHQPWSFNFALNVREKKEAYESIYKCWQRLGGGVAKKMGISLQAFEKRLYEKSMHGDWEEYGDQAKKLKWVDVIIHGVDDSALRVCPNPDEYTFKKFIEKYWPYENANGLTASSDGLSPEEKKYYDLNPHDFDYSCRRRKKMQ